MSANNRKIKNIQESNLKLEKRYLFEQAPPAPPAPSTSSGSTRTPSSYSGSTRTPIIPMIPNLTAKSIKLKDGTIKTWKEQTDAEKLSVAKKCGWKTKEDYEKNKWSCAKEI
jgi:hypothetical protein